MGSPVVTPDTLHDVAAIIGDLPPGDVPAAWWSSTHPEVTAAYERFKADHQRWRDGMAELFKVGGLPPTSTIRVSGEVTLEGINPPKEMSTPPRWWRKTSSGYLVPRKRTRAEKDSQVFKRFKALREIPRAVDYLPGMPDTLWTEQAAFPVLVRRPALAVLVFVGEDPDFADPPFEPTSHYTRMKLSTFHLLRERQAARKAALRS